MKTKQEEKPKSDQLVQSVIPVELYLRLKALADREDRSMSYMVAKCIREYLVGPK